MKNIYKILLTFALCFIFAGKVEALTCMYESDDDSYGKMVLTQYETKNALGQANSVASVRILGSAFLTTEDGDYEEIVPGFYATDAYNNDQWNNGWKEISTCPTYLKYVYKGGSNDFKSKDKAYACNNWSDCGDEDGDKFVLTDLTAEETPDEVGLNEMFCTYGAGDETYSYHIKFKKKNDGTYKGTYRLLRNYTSLYEKEIKADLAPNISASYCDSASGQEGSNCYTYYDGFSIRIFWDEVKNSYSCPKSIAVSQKKDTYAGTGSDYVYHIGYNKEYLGTHEFKVGGFLFLTTHTHSVTEYPRIDSTSYIDYNTDLSDDNMCVYTIESSKCNKKEEECGNDKLITLVERRYKKTGEIEYFSSINVTGLKDLTKLKYIKTEVNIEQPLDCDKVPVLYTDCYTNKGVMCKVSDQEFAGSQKIVTDKYANEQDANSQKDGGKFFSGYTYRQKICELSEKLNVYVSRETLLDTPNLYVHHDDFTKFNYNITELECNSWGFSTGYKCDTEDCKERIQRITEKTVLDIREYCNDVNNRDIDLITSDDLKLKLQQREKECLHFDELYKDLKEKEIIFNTLSGCDILTEDLKDKLIWILDIFKIAGPIMAVILGMIDFTKVLVAGEADKEMKSAWKRFKTRLISAALLFIIPMILSILINIFIGDKIDNNPYCGLIEEGILTED